MISISARFSDDPFKPQEMDSTTKKILIIVAVVLVIVAIAYATDFFNSSDSQPVNRPTNPSNKRNPSPPDRSDLLREYRKKKAKLEEEARKQAAEREAQQKAEKQKQQDLQAEYKIKAEAAIKANQNFKDMLDKQKTALDSLPEIPKHDLRQKLDNPEQVLLKSIQTNCPVLSCFFDQEKFDNSKIFDRVDAYSKNQKDQAEKLSDISIKDTCDINANLGLDNFGIVVKNSTLLRSNLQELDCITEDLAVGYHSETCINDYLKQVNDALTDDFVNLLGEIYSIHSQSNNAG